jgi:amino acid transporter
VYAWLRIAVTVLTVLSAWQLRRKKPELARPFRIPWGRTGLAYVVVAPLIMAGLALLGSDRFGIVWGLAAVAVGPLMYLLLRSTRGWKQNQQRVARRIRDH